MPHLPRSKPRLSNIPLTNGIAVNLHLGPAQLALFISLPHLMDPADLKKLRTALESEGLMLGSHQQDLQSTNQTLKTVTDSLAALSSQIQHLKATPLAQPPSPAVVPAAASFSLQSHEPCLSPTHPPMMVTLVPPIPFGPNAPWF